MPVVVALSLAIHYILHHLLHSHPYSLWKVSSDDYTWYLVLYISAASLKAGSFSIVYSCYLWTDYETTGSRAQALKKPALSPNTGDIHTGTVSVFVLLLLVDLFGPWDLFSNPFMLLMSTKSKNEGLSLHNSVVYTLVSIYMLEFLWQCFTEIVPV